MKRDGEIADLVPSAHREPSPTRVLWLSKGLALGGQERLLEFLARAHDRDRFHIECAYAAPALDHQVPVLEAAGVPCHCLVTTGRRGSWLSGLWCLLAEDRFDVVHVHSPLLAAVARPLVRRRRRSRRPLLVTTDHLEWSGYHPLTRWVNALTSPLDDIPIAVSTAVRDSMRGPARARAVVMVQGIEVDQLRSRFGERSADRQCSAAGSPPGSVDESFVVVTVANLRAQKDYATLLRAARSVIDRRPQVRFVAVGDDAGPYGEEMHALARELGLDAHFEFMGLRDDAVAVMAAGDAFVVASAFEAGPLTAMEAAALGLPLASTDVGVVADVFTDGTDCLRVPPGDPAALADALVRLIDDPELCRALGVAAGRLADERFAIDRVAADLQDLYRSCAPRRRSWSGRGARFGKPLVSRP